MENVGNMNGSNFEIEIYDDVVDTYNAIANQTHKNGCNKHTYV